MLYFANSWGDDPLSCKAYTTDKDDYLHDHIIDETGGKVHDHYEDVGENFRTNFFRLSIICGFMVCAWASVWFLKP